MMRALHGALRAVLVVLVAACGGSDGGTPPADVNTMTINAGDGQTASVGSAPAVAPSVKITNQNQSPVANIAVTFAVASGGGQVTGGSTTTNAGGIATAGTWTMGTVPGMNTLTATAAGVNGSPLTFTATANAASPATMTKQAGDNQTATPGQAVAIRPAVKVVDQFQNPIAGVTVTFAVATGGGSITGGSAATGADGVATVGGWTLGPNAGANTITATITGTGITGNPATFTATGQFQAFNPTSNVSITGNQTYASVNIPAGVTVTVSSDAVITVSGDYTQAGVVSAPCRTLRVEATGVMTVSGNISNDCTDPAADGRDLVLIGRGGYDISNNEIASSGSISIMDGPNLSITPFISGNAARRSAEPDVAEAGPYRCRLRNMKLLARPLTKAKKPTRNPRGDDGSSGTSRTSGCGQLLSGQTGGNLLVDGITMTGGSGGDGGDGTSNTSAPAIGGAGGEPGALNLVSDGDIDIQGTVTLNLGNGGAGGNATATNSAPGGNATATGGAGSGLKPRNFSSPVTISSRTGTITITGTLRIVFGSAGAGGSATATGGAGAPGNPGAKGGDATANGGKGGDVEPWSLQTANVVVFGTIDVTGGVGGTGGASNKTPGAGGNGNVPGAAGGPGGNALGRGGDGGKGQPSPSMQNVPGVLAASVLTSPGGNAGSAVYSGARGGNGAEKCPPVGGGGGKGGDAGGGGGAPGIGSANGNVGTVTFSSFGNGGDGAAGNGGAGPGGTNNATVTPGGAAATGGAGSFQPGLPGGPCPTSNVSVNLTSTSPPLSPGQVSPGNYTMQLLDAATNAVVGSMRFVAAATAFYGDLPARLGWSSGSWTADLASAMVNNQPWTFSSWRVCVLNTQASMTNPVFVEELDANGQVLGFRTITPAEARSFDPGDVASRPVTSPQCLDITLNANTRSVRHRGAGGDINTMGGVGRLTQAAMEKKN